MLSALLVSPAQSVALAEAQPIPIISQGFRSSSAGDGVNTDETPTESVPAPIQIIRSSFAFVQPHLQVCPSTFQLFVCYSPRPSSFHHSHMP
jgi:hypothetical protein